MNVEVRMGDNSGITGSSRVLVGELTDTALRGGKWLINSDVICNCGGKIRFPSNLTRGESLVDIWDIWDGDIGASSKKQSQKKKEKKRVRESKIIKH